MNKQIEFIKDSLEEGTVVLSGLDNCIIGTTTNHLNLEVLVYSVSSILEVLRDRDNMEPEDALEFFFYNISGAYLGDTNPIYLHNELNT
jgi:hypothetical protein